MLNVCVFMCVCMHVTFVCVYERERERECVSCWRAKWGHGDYASEVCVMCECMCVCV